MYAIERFLQNPASRWAMLVVFALLISVASHAYFIIEKMDGILMTGINDGMSQMLPFKKFIYDEYTEGNFFYSDSFGIGGGFFSQLGYYFSTNIFFLIELVVVFALESSGWIEHPDINFWAAAILPMSIFKQTAIMLVAVLYFKKLSFHTSSAFLGAVIYATSVIYFRHAMYWDFFSDAMFWLVLLLLGTEKLIRKESKIIFVLAIAFNLITNFYFSYVNFIIVFFYVLLRLFIKFSEEEETAGKQMGRYLFFGAIGALIGAFAFIPSVASYLGNFRPAYTDEIPLVEMTDNILFNSRVLFLPVFVVLALCLFRFYKYPVFRFFAIFSIAGTVLHFVPFVGSMFNGFSAPQNRWEYFVCLTYGGVTAFAFERLKMIRLIYIVPGIVVFGILAAAAISFDPYYDASKFIHQVIPVLTIAMVAVLIFAAKGSGKQRKAVLFVAMTLFMIIVSNHFQAARLSVVPKDSFRATDSFMASEHYYSQEQQELMEKLNDRKSTPHSRIDWMVPLRNNTPIVQDYNGTSLYSSILNKNILFFYYHYAQIDMDRESVSRYATFGDRANLFSQLNGQFYVRDKETATVPYGFKQILETDNYRVYENEYLLPAFRKVDTYFNEEELLERPALEREHAMLQGAIVEEDEPVEFEKTEAVKELEQLTVKPVGAVYEDGVLKVEDEKGGLEISLSEPVGEGDLYVSFYLDGIQKKDPFLLEVNEYKTLRKESDSIYRTNVNDLVIRIAADEQVSLQLPKGSYKFSELKLHYEDYKELKQASGRSENIAELPVVWQDGKVEGEVVSEKAGEMIVTPIPYEKGWKLTINGQERPVQKVNYSFVGIPLEKGNNSIELSYSPPYFFYAVSMTAVGLLLFILIVLKQSVRSFEASREKEKPFGRGLPLPKFPLYNFRLLRLSTLVVWRRRGSS